MADRNYTAVLFSAGLDSAVLLADAAAAGPAVPIYVSVGFAWEETERTIAARLLASEAFRGRGIEPLVSLTFDMRDVYPPTHWAIRGEAPAYDTPDEDVYLEGRNIILLSKASVYMARHHIGRVLMGQLGGNPFPDATAAFFSAMGTALSRGLAATIQVDAPFREWSKADVIRRGLDLQVPFELTLSCMQPQGGRHCGRCSKCRERREAFREVGIADSAVYATQR